MVPARVLPAVKLPPVATVTGAVTSTAVAWVTGGAGVPEVTVTANPVLQPGKLGALV
jgi:hypothetical protein